MKEQVQVPFDSNSSANKDQDSEKPKSLGRPAVATSLLKPRARRELLFNCSCGTPGCRYPEGGSDPIFEWVYIDATTKERVYDESLPKRGRPVSSKP